MFNKLWMIYLIYLIDLYGTKCSGRVYTLNSVSFIEDIISTITL